ncbi:hypothetical protein HPB47_013439 [Ixodes persulcatus]|uniref:Uncharacterized protein n=1 Tax=Ixodes persulcatus TaxID=34615 RepID=A0AC60QYH8_IXOPE|nr:hypothetical protein HPB47_013439 [Ixodes persulcatus]
MLSPVAILAVSQQRRRFVAEVCSAEGGSAYQLFTADGCRECRCLRARAKTTSLKKDAVPSMFETPRAPFVLQIGSDVENLLRTDSSSNSSMENLDEPNAEPGPPQLEDFVTDIQCPSKYWTQQHFKNAPTTIAYASSIYDPTQTPPTRTEKTVMFHVSSTCQDTEAQELLNGVDKKALCRGAGEKREFAALTLQDSYLSLGEKHIFSTKCKALIEALPPKQQEAVRHCFRAAQRKSVKGISYSANWLLECIILRMKSRSLYEHMRHHQILLLPSRSCLRKYLKNFRGMFGFNPELLKTLKLKTAPMPESERHGGLVLDELKLSEHLTVAASGHLQGFVDLDKFTPPELRAVPADHGLLLVFQPFMGDWIQIIGKRGFFRDYYHYSYLLLHYSQFICAMMRLSRHLCQTYTLQEQPKLNFEHFTAMYISTCTKLLFITTPGTRIHHPVLKVFFSPKHTIAKFIPFQVLIVAGYPIECASYRAQVHCGEATPAEASSAGGVFASRGNVKGHLLSKIITEAIILCEEAGLFVDYLCCDGASWNRNMWHSFGIEASLGSVQCKCEHPVDLERHIFFISDFPHLVKCVRNLLLDDQGFNTHEGHVQLGHIQAAFELDANNVTAKAMPQLTLAHIKPNSFEKMRVNLAFQLFTTDVLRGLLVFQTAIEEQHGDSTATAHFVELIRDLIAAMSSRTPTRSLRRSSEQLQCLQAVLNYLNEWETHAQGRGFLSKSTAEGLRVTLTSTQELLEYLTEKVGYTFLMTSRLSQDCVERLFGIIRQFSGSNEHPGPSQFLIIASALQFYSLARSPKKGNTPPAVVSALLSCPPAPKEKECLAKLVDKAIDNGDLETAEEVLDHLPYVAQKSDARLLYYMAGYAARKTILKSSCSECKTSCLVAADAAPEGLSSATQAVIQRSCRIPHPLSPPDTPASTADRRPPPPPLLSGSSFGQVRSVRWHHTTSDRPAASPAMSKGVGSAAPLNRSGGGSSSDLKCGLCRSCREVDPL